MFTALPWRSSRFVCASELISFLSFLLPPLPTHFPLILCTSLPHFLSLLQSIEKQLLTADFEDIMGLISAIQENVDAEDLMTLAWTLPVRRKDIQRHEKAYALLEGKEVRVNI